MCYMNLRVHNNLSDYYKTIYIYIYIYIFTMYSK